MINNGVKKMKFKSFYGGDDGEYNGIVFVEIPSKIFGIQDAIFFGTQWFDRV